ncbi:winged helix-turn-helix transcriptional regulator [Pseudoalteromonas sp. MMG013]|uniref:ArsR/SmtB family transcription factor n=1 Tax=Pseudoalteromonas sp. MMG013 TaxID=2822687 RepID=UPI001B37900F|nr:metalloregulator ArsR/SmtB family transcription factor [Pseudoalteromonas sp. MMG013]MBQ4862722.1 winged helix-turn-helix transcriptional regulator [Pseudoalteromonas sp. MMG013]
MTLANMADNAEQAASLLKMMANKHRLMILCSLVENEMSVGQLNHKVLLSQSALSQHLASLRKANIVSTRREKQTIYYMISDENVVALITSLYQLFCLKEP